MSDTDLRSRLTSAFSALAATALTQWVAVGIGRILRDGGQGGYFSEFVLPQGVYPLLNILLVWGVFRLSGEPLRRAAPIRPLRWGEFLPWLGLFAGTCGAMNLLTDWAMRRLPLPSSAPPMPGTPGQTVGYLTVLCLLPPLSEELLCRVGIAGVLKDRNPVAAVWISAFAFALLHAAFVQLPFALCAGLVLGACFVRTGNFLYPVLLHFANNAWACAFTLISRKDPALWDRIGTVTNFLWIAVGVFCAVFLFRRRPARTEPEDDGKTVAKTLLTVPAFWIFVAFYLFLAVVSARNG